MNQGSRTTLIRPRRGAVPLAHVSVDVAALTDVGRSRERNEDNVHVQYGRSADVQQRGLLCVVADGMGGHQAGDVASRIAVETITAHYYGTPADVISEALENALHAANRAIWEQSQSLAQRGMGSTATAVVLYGNDLILAHVGDSRAYLIRDGEIRQVTQDHTWVQLQVEHGAISMAEALAHPDRNVLLRGLGQRPTVDVDVGHVPLRGGDTVLLCSDGLTAVVDPREIVQYAGRFTPQAAVQGLIALANERGGPDNVTVAMLRVPVAPVAARQPRALPTWSILAVVGLLVVALFAAVRTTWAPATSPRATADATMTGSPVAPFATQTLLPTVVGAAAVGSPPGGSPVTNSPAPTLSASLVPQGAVICPPFGPDSGARLTETNDGVAGPDDLWVRVGPGQRADVAIAKALPPNTPLQVLDAGSITVDAVVWKCVAYRGESTALGWVAEVHLKPAAEQSGQQRDTDAVAAAGASRDEFRPTPVPSSTPEPQPTAIVRPPAAAVAAPARLPTPRPMVRQVAPPLPPPSAPLPTAPPPKPTSAAVISGQGVAAPPSVVPAEVP